MKFQVLKNGEPFKLFSKIDFEKWHSDILFFNYKIAWVVGSRIMMKNGTEYIIKEVENETEKCN